MKKGFLLLTVLCLLLGLPAAVWATDAPEPEDVLVENADWMYPDGAGEVMLLSSDPDLLDALCTRLRTAAEKQEAETDIRDLRIPRSAFENMMHDCLDRLPELYYVSTAYGYSYNGDEVVTRVRLKYLAGYEPELYEAAVQEALDCVLPGMDDVQKALVLHDWLATHTEYDYDNYQAGTTSAASHTAYGALVERVAVCDGYARAYQYLLGLQGIESRCVSSEEINHSWNLVRLDGVWYQADVTWDDPVQTTPKPDYVKHEYFLRSDSAFLCQSSNPPGRKHYGWTSSIPCTDDRYEYAFWREYQKKLLFLNAAGTWELSTEYDQSAREAVISLVFRDWDTGTKTVQVTQTALWYVWKGEGRFWTRAYTSLCLWNGALYYNDSQRIYRFDGTGTPETALSYSVGEGYIYGLREENDTLMVYTSTGPNDEGTWYDSGFRPGSAGASAVKDAVCARLRAAAEERESEVDLREFHVPVWLIDSLFYDCVYRMPDMYFLGTGFDCYYTGGFVDSVCLQYAECEAAAMEAAVQEALACVLPGMDDVQKALVLHDWLVRTVEYDEESRQASSGPTACHMPSGALVNHLAVCDGYARAYQYLLWRAGIESRCVTSTAQEHAWTLVKLDGEWYNVDVTWDDPNGIDDPDYTSHEFFLRSDEAYLWRSDNQTDKIHYGWVSEVSCTDDRYEYAFWQEWQKSLLFLDAGGTWELKNEYDESVRQGTVSLVFWDWATGAKTERFRMNDRWYVWDKDGYHYTSAYASLCRWYDALYFNDSLHIYRYDPETDEKETVFTYDGAEGYFYGLRLEGDRLLVRVSTGPNDAGAWYDTGLEPVISPACVYLPDTLTMFVNSAFAGEDILLCAGYNAEGRMLYACFLTPDEGTVLPLEAPAVRIFRLGSGFVPAAGKPVDMLP